MGNEVADGVVDKSSTKFDAKTIKRVFSRMLKLVTFGLMCCNFFSIFFVWSIVVVCRSSTGYA